MSRITILPLVVVPLLCLGLAGGCTPGQQPEPTPTGPTPDPRPHYQPVPRDICHRLRIDEIAERFDLSVPSGYDPAGTYFDERQHTRHTRTLCLFRAEATGDRFATEAYLFEPVGLVDITVYQEPADTRRAYDSLTRQLSGISDDQNDTVTPIDGWWDDGQYLEHLEDQGAPEGVGPMSYVQIILGFHHVNLYVEASMEANPNSEEVAEATAAMHELLRALLDETVRHLGRAE